MARAEYDGRATQFPLTIVDGADLAFALTVTDSSDVAVDLSATTIAGELYDGTDTLVDTMTAAVSGAGNNVVTLSLTDTETGALSGVESWCLWVTRGGDKRPWLAGRATVVQGDRGKTSTSGDVTLVVDSDVNVAVTVNAVGTLGIASQVEIEVRNTSGSTLTKGTPVYISGYNVGQNLVEVSPADASSTATMPAIGLVAGDIANNATGTITAQGRIADIDTSAYTIGDRLYVSETAGQLTTTRPTAAAQAQSVGEVVRVNVANGVLDISLSQTFKTGLAAELLTDGTTADMRSRLATPGISTGAVAPASTPTAVGDIYVDTVAATVYVATGTTSAADWTGILTS